MFDAQDDMHVPRQSHFIVEDFDTISTPRVAWCVKGLWPSVGVCFVAGPSMAGKSFFVLDAMASVCRGDLVLGRRSVRGGVLYVGAEGANGLRKRIDGLRRETGPLGGAFKFIGQAPQLTSLDDIADLRSTIEEVKSELAFAGLGLSIVVIDTLSASIPGADENSAKDMSPVLTQLQSMATELDMLVLIVHHTGKVEERGLRGWSGLTANADGLILIEVKEVDGNFYRVGTVTKVKDGQSGERFALHLRVVELGVDEDGDPVTTCVVEYHDAPERPKKGRPPAVCESNSRIIRKAYERLFDGRELPVMALGADGATGVLKNELKEQSVKLGLGGSHPDFEPGASEADKKEVMKRWHDGQRKAFDRALDLLKTNHSFREENGLIWDAKQAPIICLQSKSG
jgi:hypothetical protein